MDPVSLRTEFPVRQRRAYLNAGTDGPVPAAAVQAARAALDDELANGRYMPHFEARIAAATALREGYARVLGCGPEDVALTTSTSEGIGAVLAGLDLGPGDEIVTSDQEHPGVLGPLRAARDRGATIRMVALCDVADAVGPATRLVACSHVSWIGGEVAPAALAELDVPVILDGAQGAGAVPVDVAALGCAAYAAAGQKWLCGADGTGMLYVSPAFRD
jgi:selenocysteine lyase/cysteine desulfurase